MCPTLANPCRDRSLLAGASRDIGLTLKYVASRQLTRFRGCHLVSDTKLGSHRRETWVGRP